LKISREAKTGILVLAGIILFIFGFNYLKGQNVLDGSRTYYTEYDNVEGLVSSTPVTINGLKVGKVTAVGFKGDGSGKITVEMVVDTDFKFSKNSIAEIYEAGLIGGKAVAIKPAGDGAAIAEDKAVLEGTIKAGITDLVDQRLAPLQKKVEIMMLDADSLLTNVNDVLDDDTRGNLRESIAGLNTVINNFAVSSAALNAVIASNQDKLNTTLTNVDNIASNLSKTTNQIAKVDLEATINNLKATMSSLNTVTGKIENGEGSIGKLLKDEGLYNNLEGASLQLEQLLQDMKLNPKRYVHFSLFGKKPKRYDEEGNEIEEQN
jgi:phospholipid/cholesterol/gamma-HCH transport system substrate-binding protein